MLKTWFIDLDGTLNDLHRSWAEYHNAHCLTCKQPLNWRIVDHWDTHNFVDCGTSIYQYLDVPDVYLNANPQPHAQAAMLYLNRKYDVYIVTSCHSPNAINAKYRWIEQYFPYLKDRIITTDHKHLLSGDVIIDDKPSTIMNSKLPFRVCYDQRWNRSLGETVPANGFFRMTGWIGIYALEAEILSHNISKTIRNLRLEAASYI